MTDEPIESIPPPQLGSEQVAARGAGRGDAAGSGHATGVAMVGNATSRNPFASPVRPIPPEVRAIPARTPGFAPRQRSASAGVEQPVLRPAAGSEAPMEQAQKVYQEPVQEVPWASFSPETVEYSRRRNNLIIGTSAAAAVAVAIGAISLTHGSAPAPSAEKRFGAAFGPGAGDPTENPGQPLEASASGPTTPSATTSSTPQPPPAKPPAAPPKPPPTKPVTCTGWHTTHIPAHDGKAVAATAAALRTGPYGSCGGVAAFTSGQQMYIWCHANNTYGSTYVYGRIDNTSAPGWQAITAFKPGAKLGPAC